MTRFSDDAIRVALRCCNPWWDGAPIAALDTERRFFPRFKKLALCWKVHRSIVLMGPRRVGKTVMLNQLMRHAAGTGLPPHRILFASVDDPVLSGVALEKLLFRFEEMTQHEHTDRRLVIFDEIQYLDDWETHLKVLTDKYPNTRFIASGSAASILHRRSRESGLGRFSNFFLPPLTFPEFLDFRNQTENLIRPDQNARGLEFAATDIDLLNGEFVNYVNFGGYPEVVLEQPGLRGAFDYYLRRYVVERVLDYNLAGLYRIQDTRSISALLAVIAFHSGREISVDSIAEELRLSRNTVNRYLDYLEAAYLIARVRRLDDAGREFRRSSKIMAYIMNPSLRAAFFGPLNGESQEELDNMARTAVFGHYHRCDDRSIVHYARYKSGRSEVDVDFVISNVIPQCPQAACDVTWSDRDVGNPASQKGLLDLARKMPKNVTVNALTRTVSSTEVHDGIEIRHCPCALHCYQVGMEAIERKAPWTLAAKDGAVDSDI